VRGAAARVSAVEIEDGDTKPRSWLAVIGLTSALFGALLELAAVAYAFRQDAGPGDGWTTLMLMLIFLFPLVFGLWLAHIGEPGLARRFSGDAGALLFNLTRPAGIAAVLRNPMGLALVTAMVCVPLMLIWQRQSPLIAVNGLIVYSLADPLQNLLRRSWWIGAFLSAASWTGLLLVLVVTAEAISPMHEGSLIFLLPMMIYAAAIAFSGVARLAWWAAKGPEVDRGL
jgi:hypothetical protein